MKWLVRLMTKPPIPPVSTEPDAELQRFLIAQINGWKMSEHAPERLARVVEIAVRQQVRAEVATSLSSPTAHSDGWQRPPHDGSSDSDGAAQS